VKTKDTFVQDMHQVDQILQEAKVVKETNANQIRLFLNGNPKSHLSAKFAHLHPTLWGKYPMLTTKEVESTLRANQPIPIDPRYQIFENLEHAKKFTETDLESLADWNVAPEALKKNKIFTQVRIDGRLVSFGSEPELKTFQRLKDLGVIASFRAQHLRVPYASYIKGDKNYYPDFVFLTPEGYIAIVESKPIALMSYFVVEAKYHFLKRYCEAHGFLYAMLDENLTTIEQVRKETLPKDVTQYADHLLETARIFDDGAMEMVYLWFKEEGYTQLALKTILSKHWIQRELVNKSTRGFLIKKRRKINYDLLEKMTNIQSEEAMKRGNDHGKTNH
jgi:hypothetical protein